MADSLDSRNLPEVAEALDAFCSNLTARLADAERLAAAQPALIARTIWRVRS